MIRLRGKSFKLNIFIVDPSHQFATLVNNIQVFTIVQRNENIVWIQNLHVENIKEEEFWV